MNLNKFNQIGSSHLLQFQPVFSLSLSSLRILIVPRPSVRSQTRGSVSPIPNFTGSNQTISSELNHDSALLPLLSSKSSEPFWRRSEETGRLRGGSATLVSPVPIIQSRSNLVHLANETSVLSF